MEVISGERREQRHTRLREEVGPVLIYFREVTAIKSRVVSSRSRLLHRRHHRCHHLYPSSLYFCLPLYYKTNHTTSLVAIS